MHVFACRVCFRLYDLLCACLLSMTQHEDVVESKGGDVTDSVSGGTYRSESVCQYVFEFVCSVEFLPCGQEFSDVRDSRNACVAFGLLGFEVRMVGLEMLLFGAQTVVNHPLLLSDRSPRLAFCLFSVTHFSFWIDLCMYVTAPLQLLLVGGSLLQLCHAFRSDLRSDLRTRRSHALIHQLHDVFPREVNALVSASVGSSVGL